MAPTIFNLVWAIHRRNLHLRKSKPADFFGGQRPMTGDPDVRKLDRYEHFIVRADSRTSTICYSNGIGANCGGCIFASTASRGTCKGLDAFGASNRFDKALGCRFIIRVPALEVLCAIFPSTNPKNSTACSLPAFPTSVSYPNG